MLPAALNLQISCPTVCINMGSECPVPLGLTAFKPATRSPSRLAGFFWGRPIVTDACRYCGSLAQYGDSRIDVPCCRECYSLLLDRAWLGTFAERRDFVRCVLANRYARILHAPRWTAAEIDELEGNLKKQVIELQQLRDVIENRLDWQGESVQDEAR